MTFAETTLLGAIAGSTIFLGLPVGRMQRVSPRARVALSMLAAGILVFILVDVCAEGMGIVEAHLESFREDHASFAPVLGLFAVLAGGFLIGVGGIATAQRWLVSRQGTPPLPPVGGAESAAVLDASELTIVRRAEATAERRALGTAMTIAVAIGLHNFAEGLAIGVSAQAGNVSLATVLIIGFALHNATEGFGIVGPLGTVRPTWRWLALVGVIGGAPTLLGTMLGYQVSSGGLELLFYALAGGAILYVIGEIWSGVRRYGHHELGLYMLGIGFLLGVATDLVVAYGGG